MGGNVGIYYRHGALKDRVTDPGVHFLMPFFESFREIQIRPETVQLEPVLAITKDGIENTFREITVITTIRKDKLFTMVKAYGSEFKRTLVYDRIKEDLRIFCANNTIDDVYNVKFLDIRASEGQREDQHKQAGRGRNRDLELGDSKA